MTEQQNRWKLITRNYSRKEGPEMFSLTVTREIEADSTFFRQRAESYIALYDVQIQLLEEMCLIGYVEKHFITSRKKGIATQLNALIGKLEEEITSGELSIEKVYMNISTIDSVYERIGNLLPERKEIEIKFNDNVSEASVEVVGDVEEVVSEKEDTIDVVDSESSKSDTKEVVEEVVEEEVVEEEVVEESTEEVAEKVDKSVGDDFWQ